MAEKNQKIRIKDIAELAGVSEGTVDRVLHDRGDVSEKSKEAVSKVLKEMNYSPNLLARSLASKKKYRFVSLIPYYSPEEYWESVDKGFDDVLADYEHYNVTIEKYYFNQFEVRSFVEVKQQILETEFDGIILAPIFKNETLAFTQILKLKNIPFSFIDSMIPEADFLTYYGQHSFQSGYLTAKLLLELLPKKSQVIIIRTQRKGSVSNQTISRYQGFMKFIEDNHLQDVFELINVEFINNDESSNQLVLQQVFLNYNNISAAITFNSKVYRLALHLEALKKCNIRLIGYDLLNQNVHYLRQGIINCLIAQRPEKQAYFSVRDMCKQLIFKQEIKKINYVPIDVLFKENIDDYMDFVE